METSAEAIQEDEELIEAVEQIVEKAAEAIYEDIKNDFSGFYIRTRFVIENMFPFLVYWREDRSFFWADMQSLAITCVLFCITFWVLSPSRWTKKSSSIITKRTMSFQSIRFNYFRKLSPFCKVNESTRPLFERSQSTSSIVYQIHRSAELEEEEESEEDKFLKRWPSVLETGYACLVLPPECKRMEKPKRPPKMDKTEENKKEDNENVDDDDDPANRLKNYTRQFLHLIMTLLRFDFVGVGWTIIHWVDACVRSRKNRGKPDEDDEDDQSDAGSVRRAINNATNLIRRPRLRSKRDSIMRIMRKTKLNNAQTNGEDPGDTNDSSDQVHLSLCVEPSMTDETEEKKESSSAHGEPETPPQSPVATLPRSSSFNSVYETPSRDFNDMRDLDPGEVLAAKHLNYGVKTKDALEVRSWTTLVCVVQQF